MWVGIEVLAVKTVNGDSAWNGTLVKSSGEVGASQCFTKMWCHLIQTFYLNDRILIWIERDSLMENYLFFC